jgi:hypothetical protein
MGSTYSTSGSFDSIPGYNFHSHLVRVIAMLDCYLEFGLFNLLALRTVELWTIGNRTPQSRSFHRTRPGRHCGRLGW